MALLIREGMSELVSFTITTHSRHGSVTVYEGHIAKKYRVKRAVALKLADGWAPDLHG